MLSATNKNTTTLFDKQLRADYISLTLYVCFFYSFIRSLDKISFIFLSVFSDIFDKLHVFKKSFSYKMIKNTRRKISPPAGLFTGLRLLSCLPYTCQTPALLPQRFLPIWSSGFLRLEDVLHESLGFFHLHSPSPS